MTQFNTFTLRLTDYIVRNHPDLIKEKLFIAGRGQAATVTFAECSRMGMTFDEAWQQAMQTLYQGLLFSPYTMVNEIIDTHFSFINRMTTYRDSLVMQILAYVKPTLSRYHNEQNDAVFQGSDAYVKAYDHVKRMINKFVLEHGLQ